jgi:hypothetical protein
VNPRASVQNDQNDQNGAAASDPANSEHFEHSEHHPSAFQHSDDDDESEVFE